MRTTLVCITGEDGVNKLKERFYNRQKLKHQKNIDTLGIEVTYMVHEIFWTEEIKRNVYSHFFCFLYQ